MLRRPCIQYNPANTHGALPVCRHCPEGWEAMVNQEGTLKAHSVIGYPDTAVSQAVRMNIGDGTHHDCWPLYFGLSGRPL